MIAQIMFSGLLLVVLLYARTAYRQSPPIGFVAALAALMALYFVWFPDQATALAELVGIGRGVDLIIYIWVVISLIMIVNLHLKLRAHMELITKLARAMAIEEASEKAGETSRGKSIEKEADR